MEATTQKRDMGSVQLRIIEENLTCIRQLIDSRSGHISSYACDEFFRKTRNRCETLSELVCGFAAVLQRDGDFMVVPLPEEEPSVLDTDLLT